MSPLINRGRLIVGTVIGVNLLMGFSVIGLAILMKRDDQLLRVSIKFAAMVATAYSL